MRMHTKYAESDHFEILLFGVSVDNGPVIVYDLTAGDEIPTEILAALSDDTVTKWAFNASFERICLSNWLRKHHPEYFRSYNSEDDPVHNYLNPSSWKCTMIWSAYMGLPLSLEGVGAVLNLQDQKMKEGKDLSNTSAALANPPMPTVAEPEIYLNMHRINGKFSNPTIAEMLR